MVLKVEIDSFSYSEKTILQNIYFQLKAGEHLSILGESGGGKSTLLHLIYGLLPLEVGAIFYEGTKLLGPEHSLIPGHTFMKLVSQEFNLMPFTTVSENLTSNLSPLDSENHDGKIEELLDVVGLGPYKNILVKNLSGGQKQCVALAKALAKEPEILLLDEPFSNIDSFKKRKLRRNLFQHLRKRKIGCIAATHDSGEALAFSDRILMLQNGRIAMLDTPEKVYANVSDEYQAGFFGEVNFLPKHLFTSTTNSEKRVVYPHQLQVSSQKTPLRVKVIKSYFKGSHYLVQGLWGKEEVFFEHSAKLEGNKDIFLKYRN